VKPRKKRLLREVVVALAITLPLASCKTIPKVGVAVTNCASDPDSKAFLCNRPDGSEYVLLWEQAVGQKSMVCRPAADDAELKKAAFTR
jgi:hypothetical protein